MKLKFFLLLIFSLILFTNQLELNSSDIKSGKRINDKFTPQGKDVNPAFSWSNAPEETKSFAFYLVDPDAPSGNFYHWIVYNISSSDSSIKQGKLPDGAIEVTNSWGIKDYKGPQPPNGQKHNYHFVLVALNNVPKDLNSIDDFTSAISNGKLASSEIVAPYSTNKLK